MTEPKGKTTFWSLFKAGVFLFLLAALVFGIVLYRRTHQELRQFFIETLAAQIVGVDIDIDQVQLLETQGVRLHGVRFLQNDELLLNIEEIQIDCPFSLQKLLNGTITPSRISIRYPSLHLADLNSFTDLQKEICFKISTNSPGTCPIEVHNGSIIFRNNPNLSIVSSSSTSPSVAANGSILPNETDSVKTNSAAPFESEYVISGIEANLQPPVLSTNSDDFWNFNVRILNPFVKSLEINGSFLPTDRSWTLSGTVSELELTEDQFRILGIARPAVRFLKDFQGHATASFKAVSDPNAEKGYRFNLVGTLFRAAAVLTPLSFADSKNPNQVTMNEDTINRNGDGQTDVSTSSKQTGTMTVGPAGTALTGQFDSRFCYSLSDLFVQFTVTEKELKIERMTARNGSMTLLADYFQNSLTEPDEAQLRLQVNNLTLDSEMVRALTRALPPAAKNEIDKFTYSGIGNFNLNIKKTGSKWQAEHVSFLCEKADGHWRDFPYPLTNVRGEIRLNSSEELSFCFLSDLDNRTFRLQGKYSDLLGLPEGKLEVRASGFPIDGKLLKAIPDNWRSEILKLNPNGFIDLSIDITKPPKARAVAVIAIDLRDVSVKHEQFPFPTTGISGRILRQNDIWYFQNLKGGTQSTVIRAEGILQNGAEQPGSHNLAMQLQMENFPLGEELESALIHFPQAELIRNLHLRGKADAVARINYQSSTGKYDLEFEARPKPGICSIRPDIFPYELTNLDGLIVYRKGEIVIENLRGSNGQTQHQAGIHCRLNPDGSWLIDISDLAIDQILFSEELQRAVPSAVLSFLYKMKLNGYFNVNGSLQFVKRSVNAPIEIAWDTSLILQQNRACFNEPIENICGKIHLRGLYTEGEPIRIHGELDMDSFNIKSIQISKVTGPFYYDGKRIFFGQAMPHPLELDIYLNSYLRERLLQDPLFRPSPPPIQPTVAPGFARGQIPNIKQSGNESSKVASAIDPFYNQNIPGINNIQNVTGNRLKTEAASALPGRRPVIGRLFGGALQINGSASLEKHQPYSMSINVQDASLQDAVRDLAQKSFETSGRFALTAAFQGDADSSASLKGDGLLNIYDAALYRMPFILKVLTGLSVKQEDQTAFNSGEIHFYTLGHKVSLDRVILAGRALTLFGNGWLILEENQRYVDLRMNSRLGTTDSQIPVISNVIGGAGDQIAQIRIEGPLSEPTIWTERFPGIKKAWWSIFPGSEPDKTDLADPKPPARPFLNGLKKL